MPLLAPTSPRFSEEFALENRRKNILHDAQALTRQLTDSSSNFPSVIEGGASAIVEPLVPSQHDSPRLVAQADRESPPPFNLDGRQSPRAKKELFPTAAQALLSDRTRPSTVVGGEKPFQHPLDAPETPISMRARGLKSREGLVAEGAWECAGGYEYNYFKKGGQANAWAKPLHGDCRLRQLNRLATTSVDHFRIVEQSAHEMKIISARRRPNVITASGYPSKPELQKAMIDLALETASRALDFGFVVEAGLAKFMEQAFDDALGRKWKCMVGLTCMYARGGISGLSGDPHVFFTIGQLPFLIFKEQHHALLSARTALSEASQTKAAQAIAEKKAEEALFIQPSALDINAGMSTLKMPPYRPLQLKAPFGTLSL